jgi:hypothetical protein
MGYRSPYSCGFWGWVRLEAAWLNQMVSDVCCPIAARDRPANEFAATTRPSRHLNLRLHPRKLRSVWLPDFAIGA